MINYPDGVRTINVGALVLLSEGQYSDYAVRVIYRVVTQIPDGVMPGYLERSPQHGGYRWDARHFTEYLVQQGYVERVSSVEWHRYKNLRTGEWEMTIEDVDSELEAMRH